MQELVNPISDADLIHQGNAAEGVLVNQDKLLTLFTLAFLTGGEGSNLCKQMKQ